MLINSDFKKNINHITDKKGKSNECKPNDIK